MPDRFDRPIDGKFNWNGEPPMREEPILDDGASNVYERTLLFFLSYRARGRKETPAIKSSGIPFFSFSNIHEFSPWF